MFEWIRTDLANLRSTKFSSPADPTVSFRVRYYRTSDSETVRQILRESKLSGGTTTVSLAVNLSFADERPENVADSPLHQMTMAEFKKPRAITAYLISILGFVLGARSLSLSTQCIGAALVSFGFISITFSVLKVRLGFIKFVNDGLAEDVSAIPQHYQMVSADKDGDVLIPVGKNSFWVAEAYGLEAGMGTEIAGCIGLDTTTNPATELRRMAVASKYRGRGVATMLIKSLIEHARVNNIDSIFLRMSAANTNALAVYQRFGWVITDRRRYKNVEGYLLNLKVSECPL